MNTPLNPGLSDVFDEAHHVARRAMRRLNKLIKASSFPLNDAITECYDLVGVGARLLSYCDRDTVIGQASAGVEQMQNHLGGFNDRNPFGFAVDIRSAMLPYIEHAKVVLGQRYPVGTFDIMTQLFEAHAEPYFAADPDVNPNFMMRLVSQLYEEVLSQDGEAARDTVDSIFAELNRAPSPASHQNFQIDRENIVYRNASSDHIADVRVGWVDLATLPNRHDNARLGRLKARLDLLGAQQGHDDEKEQVQTEIDHIWAVPKVTERALLEADDCPF